jgi:hypothetical protein
LGDLQAEDFGISPIDSPASSANSQLALIPPYRLEMHGRFASRQCVNWVSLNPSQQKRLTKLAITSERATSRSTNKGSVCCGADRHGL